MSEILLPDWSFAKAIVPSDTADNARSALYLHNRGTAGSAVVVFQNGSEEALYFPQGATLRGGLWKRVKATGLGAGVSLVGLY